MITTRYPIARFDKCLTRQERTFNLDDLVEYSCIGVRLNGLGAYVREIKQGSQIKRKRQSLVMAGDVLYNKLFAWRGTFAVADASVDGCIASDKFPLYALDRSKVDEEYIRLWFMTRQLQVSVPFLL